MKKIILVVMSSLILASLNLKAAPNYGLCDANAGNANPHCLQATVDGLLVQLPDTVAIGSALDSLTKGLEQGISVSSAIASIPKLDRDKIFSIGVGFGGMDGQSAAAVGASARISDHFVVNGNVGHGLGSTYSNINTTVWGAGGALSW